MRNTRSCTLLGTLFNLTCPLGPALINTRMTTEPPPPPTIFLNILLQGLIFLKVVFAVLCV